MWSLPSRSSHQGEKTGVWGPASERWCDNSDLEVEMSRCSRKRSEGGEVMHGGGGVMHGDGGVMHGDRGVMRGGGPCRRPRGWGILEVGFNGHSWMVRREDESSRSHGQESLRSLGEDHLLWCSQLLWCSHSFGSHGQRWSWKDGPASQDHEGNMSLWGHLGLHSSSRILKTGGCWDSTWILER